MNQFGSPPGGFPPPAPFQQQWPSFAPTPTPMGPPGYPAMASPGYPQGPSPGYTGVAPYPAPMAAPPGYPNAAPVAPTVAPVASAVPMGPGGVPTFFIPDEEMVRAQYREFQEESAQRGGTRAQYVKFPGPQGQTKWDSVLPGYAVSLNIYILPAWKAGANVYRRVRSHFFRSHVHPKGSSITCAGPDVCLLCKSRDLAINSSDMGVQKRAKDYARTRTQYLYNVILLDNPTGHIDRSGQMRPFILGAGQTLHDSIQNFIAERGLISIVHPISGRPLKITRKKTGPNDMDVEYTVVDLNPSPLHAYFYPALGSLWDLDAEDKQTTAEQQLGVVQELGLPVPAEVMGGGATPGYPGQPGMPMMPPGFNPFPVGSPSGPVMMPPPSFGVPPPQQQFGGFSGMPPQQQFVGMPPQQPQFGGFSGMPPQPPQFSGMPSQPMPPPPMVAPPMPAASMAPPSMPMPPPVQSGPLPANPYAPQPGPGMAPASMGGAALPGGRERCFGRFNPQDRYCQECPPYLAQQCQSLSQAGFAPPGMPPPAPPLGGPPPQPGGPTLAQLSGQLSGAR